MFRVSGGSHSNTFRFGIGKASVKPLKIEVMTLTRIQLTAVWGNEDAQSSVLVSRRRWTAIQRGAEHTVDASSFYEGKRFKVITDILGDEDHLGDMDFKVAGTKDGVTTLQMDIKVEGITPEIMKIALEQAKAGRLHILGEMNKVLSSPRQTMSEWAPSIITLKIDPEKIRDVIGKGGAVIRQITEETGTTIDIENDGTVKIASVNGTAGREAKARIELITAEVEVGRVYEGRVARLMDFGAFVTILPGRDGLVHISQISNERVERVSDKLNEGDVVKVKVLEVDRQGRVRLSMKDVEER